MADLCPTTMASFSLQARRDSAHGFTCVVNVLRGVFRDVLFFFIYFFILTALESVVVEHNERISKADLCFYIACE